MITPELNRLLNLLKDNGFGVQHVEWNERTTYADLRVYSLNDQQDNATKDEGK